MLIKNSLNQMKTLVLLLVYLSVQISNVESSDYCENELNYLCEGMKHVGCAASDVRYN